MCENCATLEREVQRRDKALASMTVDLENLQAEFLVKVNRVTTLERKLKGETPAARRNEKAREVFEYWVEKLGKRKNTKFGAGREKAINARLNEGHTVEELKRAVDGMAASRWHREKGKTDLELICRTEVHVERFISYAETAERKRAEAKQKADRDRFGTDPWTERVKRHSGRGVGLMAVERALEDRGCTVTGSGDRRSAQCPAHEDRSPSLSIKETSTGSVLLHCFAGCDTEDVIGKLGLEWSDLGPSEDRGFSNTAELHEGWAA